MLWAGETAPGIPLASAHCAMAGVSVGATRQTKFAERTDEVAKEVYEIHARHALQGWTRFAMRSMQLAKPTA